MGIIKKFELNRQGRDFVVGDIHGCFHVLTAALGKLRFDVNTDRLFSAGDLVNRGPYSEQVVQWLDLPWFHPVRGNHEEIAHNSMRGIPDYGLKCGDWISKLSKEDMYKLYEKLDRLPFAMEVAVSNTERVGILHGDILHVDWDMFLQDLVSDGPDSKLAEKTVWGRSRYKHPNKLCLPVNGVRGVYVGHTVVDEPVMIGNVVYIDTGCVYGGHLTIVNIQTGQFYKCKSN